MTKPSHQEEKGEMCDILEHVSRRKILECQIESMQFKKADKHVGFYYFSLLKNSGLYFPLHSDMMDYYVYTKLYVGGVRILFKKKTFLQNCLTYIIDQGKLAEVVSAAGKQLLLRL
jgi:hypothetical protein